MHRIRVGGAWEEADTRRVYQGGAWRTVKKAWVYASGSWRQYFIGADAMSAAVSPDEIFATSSMNTTVGSSAATAVVTGGLAPFTYAWTVISFDAGVSPSITSSTAASTSFVQTGVAASDTHTATFRVTVTDSAAQTDFADVVVSFTNIDFS